MALPPFTADGDLPPGVHPASLRDTLERFGTASARRRANALRLERIYHAARSAGLLARFVVFGSFITNKPEPNDVDIFLLMENGFDVSQLTGETRLLFDHAAAQAHFGGSVFWLRRSAALEGEQATIGYWQVKRGGAERGIVEIIQESP
ncbi:hypothetical protein BH24GEM3_BH24GEM3_03110 [soil metagenome]